jgi:nucleoside-diphosphate-sugar epimerase
LKVGIVGHTGLVGSHIVRNFPNAQKFNSQNTEEIHGKRFDLLVLSTLPAEKWKANKFPEADLEIVKSISNHLESVSSGKTLLISTVDVFENPVGVSEEDVPSGSLKIGYGANRFEFERFVNSHFGDSWTVRLPGLVGQNLKKNVIYDLRHGKAVSEVAINSQFQFYPLSRISDDLNTVLESDPGLFHLVSEPLTLEAIAEDLGIRGSVFGPPSADAAKYAVQSAKTSLWGMSGHYQVSKEESIQAIGQYLYG